MADPDTESRAVTVSLHDLKSSRVPLETLEQAFGPDSLGIILVRDLPIRYAQLRGQLLSYSSYLANLPDDELIKLENADAKYNIGWSCGKETLANGRYDTLKGSYYAQPIHEPEAEAKARKLYPDLVAFTSPNVWPNQDVLPGFQTTFEELCHLIVEVATLVAAACDRFGEAKIEGYQAGTLKDIVSQSVSTKARLLHYFPPPPQQAQDKRPDSAIATDDDWCATHLDLGALTGLTSQMFVDEAENKPSRHVDGSFPVLSEMDAHPDPKTGLWIQDRSGERTQVDIPRDCLAFQTGMALELITQGKFKAVPHFVRGAAAGQAGSIARNTLAVFTQPNLWEKVDNKRDFAQLAQDVFNSSV